MPEFFIHRWELKAEKPELFIDIPCNIKDNLLKMKNGLLGPFAQTDEPMVG
jgi:hypothetical protein